MKVRTTDALGRFEFQGLPVNCRFRINVSAKGFPQKWVLAATADQSPRHYLRGAGRDGGRLKITMAIPLDIPIRMIFADTKKPAAKVAVQAMGMNVSVLQSSNDQGLATLRLPPGKYRMSNWPARGMPYFVTEGGVDRGREAAREPLVFRFGRPRSSGHRRWARRPAGPGRVDLAAARLGWRRDGRRSRESPHAFLGRALRPPPLPTSPPPTSHPSTVDPPPPTPPPHTPSTPPHLTPLPLPPPPHPSATRIAWQDSPRTDAQGKLRAFVEPGLTRFGIGHQASPPWYAPDVPDGPGVECRAGETTTIKFTMRNVRPTPPQAVPKTAPTKTPTQPITVSGHALDPDGKPLPAARVYIASRWADYKRVAETTTDAEGRYQFVEVPLPIARADIAAQQDHGTFQVFGEAKGFGFAWRIEKQYYPNPVPAERERHPASTRRATRSSSTCGSRDRPASSARWSMIEGGPSPTSVSKSATARAGSSSTTSSDWGSPRSTSETPPRPR